MMESIGRAPIWKPETLGDKILVWLFTSWYYACFIPLWILTRTMGWSKVNWLVLDILSIPGKMLLYVSSVFGARRWGLKANALAHTHFICRMCPASRQSTRDPEGKGLCRWNRRWNEGRFDIAPDFGTRNFFRQYASSVNLERYRNLVRKED